MTVTDWLYPPTCVLCGAAGQPGLDLCVGCQADLPALGSACSRCALPLPEDSENILCGRCQRHPPPFCRTLAAVRYQESVSRMVLALKFHRKLAMAPVLARCLSDAVIASGQPLPELLIPVPLHKSRMRERGYNQALEIARPIALRLDLPLDPQRCRRTRATRPQSELERGERLNNPRGAFSCDAFNAPTRIAIIDDVVTTGATVTELTRVLKRAGAGEVEVWCVARTP